MALTISDPNIAKLDSLIKKAVPKGPVGIPFLKNMLREITLKRPQDVGSKKYLLLAGELQARKNMAEKNKGAGPKPPSVMQSLTAPAPQDGLGLDMSQPAVRNLAAQNQMATIGGKPPAGKGGGIVAFQNTGFVNLPALLGRLPEDEREKIIASLRQGRNPFPEKIKGDKLPDKKFRGLGGERTLDGGYEQIENPDYSVVNRYLSEINPPPVRPVLGGSLSGIRRYGDVDPNAMTAFQTKLDKDLIAQQPDSPVIASNNNNNISPSFSRPVDGVDEAVKIINAQTNAGVAPPLLDAGPTVKEIKTETIPEITSNAYSDPTTTFTNTLTSLGGAFPTTEQKFIPTLSQKKQDLVKADPKTLIAARIEEDKRLYGDETKNRVALINESMKGLKGLKTKLGYEALLVFAGEMGSTPGTVLDAISKGTKAATPTIINGLEKIKDNTEKLNFKKAELQDLTTQKNNARTRSAVNKIESQIEKVEDQILTGIADNKKTKYTVASTLSSATLSQETQKIANKFKADANQIARQELGDKATARKVKLYADTVSSIYTKLLAEYSRSKSASMQTPFDPDNPANASELKALEDRAKKLASEFIEDAEDSLTKVTPLGE